MLTKLAIFNSRQHAKAVISFDNATAIQIIGANKIGKTTLIDSLNFLYVIDKNKMSFDSRGGKSTYSFKDSLHHFFPHPDQSFIVFECFKGKAGGYFCILVKRKISGDDVEYFKIGKQFEESDFIDATGTLKRFTQIRKDMAVSGQIEPFKYRRDFFDQVYSQDKKRNVFLWISDKVKRKSQSLENSLTKTYRFLLNASAINDLSLQEALLIADNRQDDVLDIFTDKNKIGKVDELTQKQAYIRKINAIKEDFEEFKLLVSQTKRIEQTVATLLYSFGAIYQEEIEELKDQIRQAASKIESHKKEREVFEPQRRTLGEELGELKAEIRQLRDERILNKGQIPETEAKLEEVKRILSQTSAMHDTVEALTDFLSSRKQGLQEKFEEISAALRTVSQYQLTEAQVSRRIENLKKTQKQIENKIEKYQDLLIHNISDNIEVREKLNAILSEEITAHLTKDSIRKKVSTLDDILRINEGEIKGVQTIDSKPLESIEGLTERLEETRKELKQQQDILSAIREREQKEGEREKMATKIRDIETKIEKISQKKPLENELSALRQTLERLNEERAQKESKYKETENELAKLDERIRAGEREAATYQHEITKRQDWYGEFEEELNQVHVTEAVQKEPLERLRRKLRREKSRLSESRQKKQRQFLELQRKAENDAAEPIFVTQIEEQIRTLDQMSKSVEILLDQVSNEFTKPTSNFLNNYKEFEHFIKKFNRSLAKYTISELSELKIRLNPNESLLQDLEKISKITRVDAMQGSLYQGLDTPEQKEYLSVLKEYITHRNKNILFRNLFDITLEACDEKGNRKKIDLKMGNESQGTIRMINLILFLSVIKYFMREDEENKLVFFIDEDVIDRNNTEQLIRFCRENGFIVIFAAKHQIPDMEKYYLMFKSEAHDNKVYVDEQHAKYATKR